MVRLEKENKEKVKEKKCNNKPSNRDIEKYTNELSKAKQVTGSIHIKYSQYERGSNAMFLNNGFDRMLEKIYRT